jgi:hypothetical protein
VGCLRCGTQFRLVIHSKQALRGKGFKDIKFLVTASHLRHFMLRLVGIIFLFSTSKIMEPNIRVIYDPKKGSSPSPPLQTFEQIARLMDSKFKIPGTKIRFGIDPILSLLPVLGDVITLIISSMLIYTMHNRGASRKVVIKMMLNAGLDTAIGAVPLVGTFFDIFYRSNERNVKLLKEHYFEGKHQGSGTGLLLVILLIALVVIGAVVYGIWKLMEAIF